MCGGLAEGEGHGLRAHWGGERGEGAGEGTEKGGRGVVVRVGRGGEA